MAAVLTASLVLTLLVFSFSVSADQRIIRAKPGENVTLTCRADENRDVIVAEWSRPDLGSNQPVLQYRDKKIYKELQSSSFENRVDLLDVKNGDVSLVMKNVTTDDTGTYECRVFQRRNNRSKRSLLGGDPISVVDLRVEPGNKDGPKDDGVNSTGLIVVLSVCTLVALLVAAVLYKSPRGSSQKFIRPRAAADIEATLKELDESNPPC